MCSETSRWCWVPWSWSHRHFWADWQEDRSSPWTDLWSSGIVASAVNLQAISPAPKSQYISKWFIELHHSLSCSSQQVTRGHKKVSNSPKETLSCIKCFIICIIKYKRYYSYYTYTRTHSMDSVLSPGIWVPMALIYDIWQTPVPLTTTKEFRPGFWYHLWISLCSLWYKQGKSDISRPFSNIVQTSGHLHVTGNSFFLFNWQL